MSKFYFFIHFFGDKSTYMNFAFELGKFDLMNCDELDKIIAFITDDDPALHEAFKKCFRIRIICYVVIICKRI